MMDFDNVAATKPLVLMPITIIATQVNIKLNITINPPKIVTIDGPEFKVDMKKMKPHTPYLVEFMNLRYLIWKDEKDALVINEVT